MKKFSTVCEPGLSEDSLFMEMLLTNNHGLESSIYYVEREGFSVINEGVTARSGAKKTSNPESQIPSQFVVQQACMRYFNLMRITIESMDSIFTEADITVILNAYCGPIVNSSPSVSVASAIADDLGIEDLSDISDGTDLKKLLQKLTNLSPIQNVALVDLSERYWRHASDQSLKEFFGSTGFILS